MKNEFIIYNLDLLVTQVALKTCLSQICKEGVQFQIEIRKIRRRAPRSVQDAELGNLAADGKEIYKDL